MPSRPRLTTEYVFSNLNFPYPVFLTTFHLAFSVSLARSAEPRLTR